MRVKKPLQGSRKKPIAERTNDDVLMLGTYGKEVDFMDKGTIVPIDGMTG